ncbi:MULTISPECIES: oligosaccharide flippase family protein [Serratia]|nr:oligosaccharide flippase family protein [Serratia marcescens]
MSKNKIIVKNSLFLAIRTVLAVIISFYTTRVVLQQLGASDYGLYSVVYGIVGFTVFLSSAMNESVQRFISISIGKNDVQELKNIVINSFLSYLILGAVFLAALLMARDYVVSNFLNIPAGSVEVAKKLYFLAVLAIFLSIMQTPLNALVIAHEKMSFYAYMSIFDVISKLIVSFLISIVSQNKLSTYAILLLISSLLVFIIYLSYCISKFKYSLVGGRVSLAIMKSISIFSFWNVFGNFAFICRTQGINITMNLFFSTTVNAAYALSSSVLNALSSLTQSLVMSIRPQIFKTYADGSIERHSGLIMIGSKYTFTLLFVLSMPILLCTDKVLALWLSSTPEFTATFIRFVLVVALIDSFSSSIIAGIQASGNIKVYQMVVGFFVFISLPLTYLIYSLGYPAYSAFLPLILTSLINLNLRVYFLCKNSNFSASVYYRSVIIPCICAALLSLAINLLLNSYVVYGGVIKTLLMLGVHSLLSFFVFFIVVVSSKERTYLFDYVLRKLK